MSGPNRSISVAGLDAALHGAGLPYGYTVTVWSSGQLLIADTGRRGGGLSDSHVVRTGAMHVTSMAAAIGAVAFLALIPAGIAWLLGGFAATVLYLGGTGIVLGLRERENRRGEV